MEKHLNRPVVKYQGNWRLYLNTQMRKDSGLKVGDTAKVQIEFDSEPRVVPMNPLLAKALDKNKKAELAFEKFPPSHKRKILSYLNYLKTEEATKRIAIKTIKQLVGEK